MKMKNENINNIEKEYGKSSISVREILNIEAFKGYKILAGKAGLERYCNHIAILETPEGLDWVRGNELLLTAGYALYNNSSAINEFVEKSNNKNVSAIGIKLHRYLDPIPEIMIKQAEKYGIPLIAFPENLIYSDAVSGFYEALFYKKNLYLVELKGIYEGLFSLVLKAKDIQQVSDAISMLTKSNILVYDSVFNLLSFSLSSTRDEALVKRIMTVIQGKNLNINSNENIEGYYLENYPIDFNSKVIGYMFKISENMSNNLDKKAIDYGKLILSLKMIKQESDFMNIINIKKAISEIIMNKSDMSRDFYNNILSSYGWSEDDIFTGLCFDIKEKSDIGSGYVQRFKDKIYTVIKRTLLDNEFLVTESQDRLVIFIAANKVDPNNIVSKINILIKEYYNNIYVKYGLSMEHKSIKDMSSMYNESVLSAEFNKDCTHISCFSQIDTLKLIYPMKDNDMIRDFSKKTLKLINEYDMENSGELINTLEKYFENDMNKKVVAQKLYIHPETLRYRLNKIENLTGYSPYSSEGIFMLQLIMNYRKIEEMFKD